MKPRHHLASWTTELKAGCVGSVAGLGVVLTIGLLGFAPLGAVDAMVGIRAGFATVVVGGLLFALLGRSAMPTAGPSSATAIILSGLVTKLIADPQISLAEPAALSAVLAATSLTVVLMGILQMVLARLGIGNLVKYVPQPVLGGFMNGVAVLIVLSQLPTLLGLTAGAAHRLDWHLLEEMHPGSLVLGLGTAACIWWVGRRWPKAPAPLIGLGFGLLVYFWLQVLAPTLAVGQLIGDVPHGVLLPELGAQLVAPISAEFVLRHAMAMVGTALVLAVISSLESVLAALLIDQQVHARHDVGHELFALGMANMGAGLFGGLPVGLNRSRALATLRAGGSGSRAALCGAMAFALMFAFGGPLIALLPKAVLAGIMLTIAAALLDRWSHQLFVQLRSGERSIDVLQSLAIVGLVCIVTIWQGFAAGVALGVVVSLLVFIRSMNRSMVRARFTAASQPSRRSYPPRQEQVLRKAREHIVILELEGALFFGSADRLASEVDTLDAGCGFLILDFKRVSTIDESGAVTLQQLAVRLRRRGIELLMAGVGAANKHGQRLRAFGCFREEPRHDWFADLDRAVEAAELQTLAQQGTNLDDVEVTLAESGLMRDVDAESCAFVAERMPELHLAAGAMLFRMNDPADCLYVLQRGSITVIGGSSGTAGQRRYLSLSAGMMLGETAMLDGGGRSASAIADTDLVVWQLTQQCLDEIAVIRPALAVQLYRNIAVHLSERLRSATSIRPDLR
jgi:MFS superfamily sulfate permease-like transporter/CRP-like cAMP-binding protein